MQNNQFPHQEGLLNTHITLMLVLSHHFPTSFLELEPRMNEKWGLIAPRVKESKDHAHYNAPVMPKKFGLQ